MTLRWQNHKLFHHIKLVCLLQSLFFPYSSCKLFDTCNIEYRENVKIGLSRFLHLCFLSDSILKASEIGNQRVLCPRNIFTLPSQVHPCSNPTLLNQQPAPMPWVIYEANQSNQTWKSVIRVNSSSTNPLFDWLNEQKQEGSIHVRECPLNNSLLLEVPTAFMC